MIDATYRNHLKVVLSMARTCTKTPTMKRAIEGLMGSKTLTATAIKTRLAEMIPLADKDADFNADWVTLAEIAQGVEGEQYG